MVIRKSTQTRLTPEDWARAALSAIARGGIGAVAVEPIAAALGATKGSFYWHFQNRDALIEAALEEWERQSTDAVIEALEHESDPAVRLKRIFAGTFEMGRSQRAIEIALLNPGHRTAQRTVRRVVERRITYIADQLEKLGWGTDEALDRAVLIAYIYVGHLQIAHVAPRMIGDDSRQRYVELIFDSLVAQKAFPDRLLPRGRKAPQEVSG
ncbi:MAG: TetR/AcrR family transcriptional regulator [Actinomycetota bacterium]